MKDNLFEILLNLVEKKLAQLKDEIQSTQEANEELDPIESRTLVVKAQQPHSIRLLNEDEQLKLTKASYQFIMKIMQWKIIAPETMELIMNRLLFAESSLVTLDETKWTIRNMLAEHLDAAQLAFLDLVLYQKEDQYTLH